MVKYRLQIDILIDQMIKVCVFREHYQISVVPLLDLIISFQRIRTDELEAAFSKAKNSIPSDITQISGMGQLITGVLESG